MVISIVKKIEVDCGSLTCIATVTTMADASPRAVKRPRSGESASLGVSPALKLGVVIGNSALDLSGVVSAQKALHRDFEVCSARCTAFTNTATLAH
jgi:hypothetical protein